MRLSGETNAHAEGKNQTTTGYSEVCFGNLDCFLQDYGKQCNETSSSGKGGRDYCMIVTLSGQTNAHMALTKYYPYSVCCKAQGFSCVCDYDGVCEQGETPVNCPDCVAVCGNGLLELPEECDGNNWTVGINGCEDLGSGFNGGQLYCYPAGTLGPQGNNIGCTFNTTGCTTSQSQPQCNDGVDNDGDGTCDYQGCEGMEMDNGCSGENDDSESECGNGVLEPDAQELCDCGGEECTNEQLGGKKCTDRGYKGGTLNCTSSCTYNVEKCIGYEGFCRDNEPFGFYEGGAWLSPSSCQDYNRVYPIPEGGDRINHTNRRELCLKDCVPGASDPINNGYTGGTLQYWGCGFDEKENDGVEYNGECYFYFNLTNNPSQACRLDYTILENCGPDNPFRKVRVTAQPVGVGDWECDAGCGNGQACETQIMCPRVIELPAISTIAVSYTHLTLPTIYSV